MGFLILCTATYFLCVYISNYAETFFDYTQCMYIASAGLPIYFALTILVVQVEELFEYISRCDIMFNTSKCS